MNESLQQAARFAELQSYELPIDFLIENEPFSAANGLLSGVGKLLRSRLKERYGERLEQMYADLAAAQVDELRTLRRTAADRPVVDTLARAAQALLGSAGSELDPDAHFIDLGGDSLSALTYSNFLHEIFDVEVPVGVIISPATNLRQLADYIEADRASGAKRPTFAAVHGHGATHVRATDLTLDKFIDAETLADATALPRATGRSRTVLLTGATAGSGGSWPRMAGTAVADGWHAGVHRSRRADAETARARLDGGLRHWRPRADAPLPRAGRRSPRGHRRRHQ